MFKVDLDISALKQYAGNLTTQVLEQAVKDLGSFAADRLAQIASSQLSAKSAAAFSNGLKVERKRTHIVITLENPLAQALETGTDGFDIKPGLLKSTKAKQGVNGPYVDVPLPHEEKRVSPQVHKTIKQAVQQARRSGLSQRVKNANTDTVATPKGEAINFRRVSKNTAAQKWMYPARKGINAFGQVETEVTNIAPQVIVDIFDKLMSNKP